MICHMYSIYQSAVTRRNEIRGAATVLPSYTSLRDILALMSATQVGEEAKPPTEPDSAAERPRRVLLVTGATGRVGTGLRPYLRADYDLLLHDRLPVPDLQPGERAVQGDLADYVSVLAAVRQADAVLHLACVHGLELRFEDSLQANFRGTMTLLDAVRIAGISRYVYASSHHVLGTHDSLGLVPESADALDLAPDAVYGLGKAFGELASRMYAERYGFKTMLIRIGNADPQVGDGRALRMWTSARDLAQLIDIGLTDERVTCDVVYGVSRSPQPMFANARAEELGYRPVDDAADNLSPTFIPYEQMPHRLGRDFVGGAYTVRDLPTPLGSNEENA